MATSQIKTLHERNGKPVLVVDRFGRARWSEVFENNPRVVRRHVLGCQQLINAGGARPYIKGKTPTQWQWKHWDINPGEMFFTHEESKFVENTGYDCCIMIEPNTKVDNGNKAWIWDRWQEVVDAIGSQWFVQVGTPDQRRLRGVAFVTTTFRQAAALLANSQAFLGTEGALHHAAAALKVPAVVLWSEFISPEFTGYVGQRNIRHANGVCGNRLPCASCRESMEAITVAEVVQSLKEVLHEHRRSAADSPDFALGGRSAGVAA